MAQDHFLSFNKSKYLKWAGALCAVCVGLYLADSPPIKPGGGTWLGYGLGTLGFGLILWLMAFGLRKRAYRSNLGSVRGWLSAHVYLGLALAVVATLHTGFELGVNVHSAAYVLTLAVIASGIWGVILYVRQPALMGNLLNGQTLQNLGSGLRDIDDQCRKAAQGLSPDIQRLVKNSSTGRIFASRWQRFSGKNPDCATQRTVDALAEKNNGASPAQRELYNLQFRRLQQLLRIREFVRSRTWTEVWLLLHVPLSFGLLASLVAHVVSVFFYW